MIAILILSQPGLPAVAGYFFFRSGILFCTSSLTCFASFWKAVELVLPHPGHEVMSG
jgi:hypothetical protein